MSVESKQMLIMDFGKQIDNIVTAKDKDTILSIFTEQLSKYNLEKCLTDETDFESQQLLEAYLSAKRIEGRSEKTLERYEYIIEDMMSKINVPIRKISIFHIRTYLTSEKERGLSDRTLEGIREILSAYFGWLHREGLIPSNPISNLGAIKYAKITRLPFNAADIEKLKQNCKTDRDKAIISFLLSSGCRVSEMCQLNRIDINFDDKECIVKGKGNKERTVYIDDITVMLLKRYLDSRKDNLEALFIGKKLNRLTPSGVRKMLNTVAKRAGVQNVHPHRFRRTLATNLINHGMPIQQVAAILGHEKIDTTMGYVYIDKINLKNSYQKYQ